jgi:hypothetical protein
VRKTLQVQMASKEERIGGPEKATGKVSRSPTCQRTRQCELVLGNRAIYQDQTRAHHHRGPQTTYLQSEAGYIYAD